MAQTFRPTHVTHNKTAKAAQSDDLRPLIETAIHNGWQPYGSRLTTGTGPDQKLIQSIVNDAEFHR